MMFTSSVATNRYEMIVQDIGSCTSQYVRFVKKTCVKMMRGR